MKHVVGFLVLPALVGAAWGARLEAQAKAVDDTPGVLTGAWRLDPSKSEDLTDKFRNSRGGGMPGGMGPRTGGIGGGVSGRGGRGEWGGQRGSVGDEPGFGMLQMLRPPQQLSFEPGDGSVVVRSDLGLARPLYLDGRETVDTLGDLSVRTSKAKWKKGRLEVERKAGDFARIRETYWIDPETGLMVVDVKFEHGPRKAEARRVYERVKPD